VKAETIGVFGGAFDQPHCGHVLLAAYALSAAPIDRVLIVPTFAHPFGKSMQPFAHRVAMCSAAFGFLHGASVSSIEEELGTPSYTVRTLEALSERMPGARFRLLVGADVPTARDKWKDFERVQALAPLFVIGREGHAKGDDGIVTPDLPAISSTDVRARLREAQPVAGLVPRAVEEYVRAHALYGA
jgi:nicotinate-nucleotide adenylyltransferase